MGSSGGLHMTCKYLGEPLPDAGLFTSRFDRIYYNSQSIVPVTITDSTSDEPCPNEKEPEPSHHLPVGVSFFESYRRFNLLQDLWRTLIGKKAKFIDKHLRTGIILNRFFMNFSHFVRLLF